MTQSFEDSMENKWEQPCYYIKVRVEKIYLQTPISRYQRGNYYDKRRNLTPTNVVFTKRAR